MSSRPSTTTSRRSPTTTSRSSGVIIEVETPDDGRLYLARVEPGYVVLSTGEELFTRFERLHALAEQLAQERAAVVVRAWWTPAGQELVELVRADDQRVDRPSTNVPEPDAPF